MWGGPHKVRAEPSGVILSDALGQREVRGRSGLLEKSVQFGKREQFIETRKK